MMKTQVEGQPEITRKGKRITSYLLAVTLQKGQEVHTETGGLSDTGAVIQGQSGLSQTKKYKKDCKHSSVVEHSPSMHKIPGFNPSTRKKRKAVEA